MMIACYLGMALLQEKLPMVRPKMGHGFDPRDDCTAKAKAWADDL
jgi:hypothetical protein